MTGLILREAILPRMDGIRRNVGKLRRLAQLSEETFLEEDNLALVQHYLRLSLEGVFHIGQHILARLPGARATEYRGIAQKLGEFKVVPLEFANRHLVPMAGRRNILVHQYADIDVDRLRQILDAHLDEFEQFLSFVADLMKNPGRLGLETN
jgi:uncharacterized protein YutE (UPF0331/DUF86 family)